LLLHSKAMFEWFAVQNGAIIYFALALLLIGGGIGLPIPEDLPLLAGGIAINTGVAEPLPTFLVCYAAILAGDLVIFLLGRKLGPAIFNHRWFRSKFSTHGLRKVKVNLERQSLLMIFIARHLFYLRTVTFLTCGAVRMHIRRFLLADAAAALISVPVMLSLGYVAAEHYSTVIKAIRHAEILSVIAGVLIAAYLLYRARQKKKGVEAPSCDSH
jgi:membrane protein DedA with SNARE-associated domain